MEVKNEIQVNYKARMDKNTEFREDNNVLVDGNGTYQSQEITKTCGKSQKRLIYLAELRECQKGKK
jgi:RNA-binding protein YlmH